MSEEANFPKYIFGLHEPGGEWLMEEKNKRGWILFTHGLGHDPSDNNGHDYRRWTDRGFGAIARLNHGYGAAGTIPLPQFYDAFALRVRNFVANSHGCHIWIVGNEMNHGQERPEGQMITPDRYADCYKKCWDQVHNLPGREHDQVAIGSVAPWNNTTAYPGNENGDWVQYFVDILNAVRNKGCPVDAITLHTYTHGHDPNLVFDEQKMNPPFQNYHYHFRCYRDFMEAIPSDLRHVPVYITESDEDEPWENANRGWVQNAYKEINDWNTTPGHQQIRSLVLYRWPKFDKWHIEGKGGVYDDFRAAMDKEYIWREVQLPRRINGYTVQGSFLDFFNQMGDLILGQPISDEVIEGGLKTQYFEKVVLQQDQTGAVTLKDAGTEVRSLRQVVGDTQNEVQALQLQLQELQEKMYAMHAGVGRPTDSAAAGPQQQPVTEIVRPTWKNIIYTLPKHSSRSYEQREIGTIKHLVINHSAVPTTVPVEDIARFHVRNMDWPGVGYHFYIDGQGRIFKTNELTTTCYHVQKWDPISVGICVGGNFTRAVPNDAQLKSTAHLCAWLLQELGLTIDAIKGKKEFIDTQSPGHQWLTGQMWKHMLLSEVQQAQANKLISFPQRQFYHYLLMWQTATGWARGDWLGAQQYIGRFRVTHGFSVDDAKMAKYVTIVGDTAGVDEKGEQILIESGCRVERIAGRDTSENRRLLNRMAQRGQRFLSYAG
jgi:hypothetical protein